MGPAGRQSGPAPHLHRCRCFRRCSPRPDLRRQKGRRPGSGVNQGAACRRCCTQKAKSNRASDTARRDSFQYASFTCTEVPRPRRATERPLAAITTSLSGYQIPRSFHGIRERSQSSWQKPAAIGSGKPPGFARERKFRPGRRSPPNRPDCAQATAVAAATAPTSFAASRAFEAPTSEGTRCRTQPALRSSKAVSARRARAGPTAGST